MKGAMFILSHFVAIAGVFLALAAAPLRAEDAITLETILKSTLEKNGQIQESVQDIEIARAQLARANAAVFPKAEAVVLLAPIFEERGNALESHSNWSKWGPLVKGGAQLIQPLYTFGQIGNYQKAAEHQIIARSGQADMKRNELVLTAKEFYYGYLMANDLDKLVGDLSKFLEEAADTADENLKKGKKANVKQHDVYKLKTALEDLRQKKLLAVQGKQTAERAVAWVSGLTFEKLPSPTLRPEAFEKRTLDEYLKIAKGGRPEFAALAAGQTARLALRDAKRAQSYPVLFAGAFVSLPWSPVRDKQTSIYANDPFNRIEGGVGIGLKFDLEFWRHSAEASEEEAEAMKLKATESYAAPGIELQVKKAYWELEQAMAGLEVAERRKALARKWFVSSAMGWSIGITPAKDLLEALEGDGLAKKNYIETVYGLNMALGRLSQAVGKEITELKYR